MNLAKQSGNKSGQKKAYKPKGNPNWKKGQSGNPKGRPKKGNTYAELIRSIGDYTSEEEGKTLKQAAIEALWKKAAKGDPIAFKTLTDREAGYPKQSVDMDVGPKSTVKVIE